MHENEPHQVQTIGGLASLGDQRVTAEKTEFTTCHSVVGRPGAHLNKPRLGHKAPVVRKGGGNCEDRPENIPEAASASLGGYARKANKECKLSNRQYQVVVGKTVQGLEPKGNQHDKG